MKKTMLAITAPVLLAGILVLLQAGCATNPGRSTQTAAKPYPLGYCLVTGDKLGEMGAPVSTIYEGQEIKFCCKDCVRDFNKDPDKFLKKLAEAEKKAEK